MLNLTISKTFAIAACFTLFWQAKYIKRVLGTYIFPASLMALAWFFYTIIPIVFLFNIPINPIAICYISICVLAFSLSALPFNWEKALTLNEKNSANYFQLYNNLFMRILFFISALMAIYCSTKVVLDAEDSLFTLQNIIFNLGKVSARFAEMRPAGMVQYSIWGILSTFFVYLTPILGSLIFYYCPQKKLKLTFFILSFFPSVYCMLLQSSKIVVFYSIGFFIAGTLLMKIKSNQFDIFDKKSIAQLILAILILIPSLIVAFISRGRLTSSSNIMSELFQLLQSYLFAQTYAFADYFTFLIGHESFSKYQSDLNSFGSYTFTSIYNSFGKQKNFPPGTFSDHYQYGDQLRTNIFTIFRGLINDFGIYGTILYMYASGLIAHAFYYHLLSHKKSPISSTVFIITIVYIQATYLASLFMSRFSYLLFFIVILIFIINDRFKKDINTVTNGHQ